jgi:hypothetical protein
MIKSLLVLTFLNLVFGATTTMNNALRNQVVTDFKNAIVPIISSKIRHVSINDINGNSGGIKYEVTNININVNPINPQQINIQFPPGATIKVSGTAFAMQGSAHVKAKVSFVSVSFGVSIGISNFGFEITVAMTSVNNKPNIAITGFRLDITENHVSIKISGNIIAKIANFIINLLKGYVVRSVVSEVTKILPPTVTGVVNDFLNSLLTKIPITDKIAMTYGFPVAPSVQGDYLLTGIVAYLHPVNDPSPPPGPTKPVPQYDAKNARGIQFFISDVIVRSAVNTAYKLNLMSIVVNNKIKDRQVKMACSASALPDFQFAGTIKAVANGLCNVALDNDPNPKFQLIATLELVLAERVKNAILFFDIQTIQFSKFDIKVITPVDIEWFKESINDVLAAIKEVINGELGQKGIPLPIIKQIEYTDFVQYVGDGFTMLGTTPVFHLQMEDSMELAE